MDFKNTVDRWGPVSQFLHWLIVVLILGQGVVGLVMTGMRNSPDKVEVYALHKSFGLTILALALLRLAWRLYAGAPRAVAGMPRWQEFAARASHIGLYGLLFALPLTGWLLNSTAGFPLSWFGLVKLPAIAGKDHAMHELYEEAHELLWWVLVVLALVHAAAAFYHHLFQHDATLARMLPRRWTRVPQAPAEVRNDGVRDVA